MTAGDEPAWENLLHFRNLQEIRRAHSALLESFHSRAEPDIVKKPGLIASVSNSLQSGRKPTNAPDQEPQTEDFQSIYEDRVPPALQEKIISFLTRSKITGQILATTSDRNVAQNIMDYWVATLYSHGITRSELNNVDIYIASLTRLDSFDTDATTSLTNENCPYKGLDAFTEKDFHRFYGREQSLKRLVNFVKNKPLVILHGPSGSGKSSLLRGGLLPHLKKGAIAGSQDWHYFPVIMPGSDPLAALLSAICPDGVDIKDWISTHKEELEQHPKHFGQLAADTASGQTLVLAIDQLEELFTFDADDGDDADLSNALSVRHDPFIQAVKSVLTQPGAQHHVIATIHENFLPSLKRLRAAKAMTDDNREFYTLPRLDSDDLRQIVEEPAKEVGLEFDAGLVEKLIAEVEGLDGALPLLQFTLLRLWEERQGNAITWDTFKTVGRPKDALGDAAEEAFKKLTRSGHKEAAVKSLFLELINHTYGNEYYRRRVKWLAFKNLGHYPTAQIGEILKEYMSRGLIRRLDGQDKDDDQFEVTHESLIRNWQRLIDWLKNKKDKNEETLQLRAKALSWQKSGQPQSWRTMFFGTGFLLSGIALSKAEKLDTNDKIIREFVTASRQYQNKWRLSAGAIAASSVVAVGSIFTVVLWNKNSLLNKNNIKLQYANEYLGAEKEKYKNLYQTSINRKNNIKKELESLISEEKLKYSDVPEFLKKDVKDQPKAADVNHKIGQVVAYKPDFLGQQIPLPTLSEKMMQMVWKDGRLAPLDYYYFSLIMYQDRHRPMPIFSAANFDGAEFNKKPPRKLLYSQDARIPEEFQASRKAYADSLIFPHPLTRILIQPNKDGGAIIRNTTLVPMFPGFSSQIWQELEKSIIFKNDNQKTKVSIFSGPVFRDDDIIINKIKIPRSYWKITVSQKAQNSDQLVVDAFIANQYRKVKDKNEAGQPLPIDFQFNPDTFRVSAKDIENLTGLDFGIIKDLPRGKKSDVVIGNKIKDKIEKLLRELESKHARVRRGARKKIAKLLNDEKEHQPEIIRYLVGKVLVKPESYRLTLGITEALSRIDGYGQASGDTIAKLHNLISTKIYKRDETFRKSLEAALEKFSCNTLVANCTMKVRVGFAGEGG